MPPRNHFSPVTLWLTGLSGAGKSTIAEALHLAYSSSGIRAQILDGDRLRIGLNRDLSFSREDRHENIRRIAEVAKLFNSAGLLVTVATISPFGIDRELARCIVGTDRFLEVYVNTPRSVCEERDPKGLYRKARAGLVRDFTGISAPYEPPLSPDLTLSGVDCLLPDTVAQILGCLRARMTTGSLRVETSGSQTLTHAC